MASKGRVDQKVSNLNVYQIACLEGSQRDITCPTIYSTYIADGEEYLCAVENFPVFRIYFILSVSSKI